MDSVTKWPDLSIDQRAWDLAKKVCGPDAILSEVVAKAQEYKTALLNVNGIMEAI